MKTVITTHFSLTKSSAFKTLWNSQLNFTTYNSTNYTTSRKLPYTAQFQIFHPDKRVSILIWTIPLCLISMFIIIILMIIIRRKLAPDVSSMNGKDTNKILMNKGKEMHTQMTIPNIVEPKGFLPMPEKTDTESNDQNLGNLRYLNVSPSTSTLYSNVSNTSIQSPELEIKASISVSSIRDGARNPTPRKGLWLDEKGPKNDKPIEYDSDNVFANKSWDCRKSPSGIAFVKNLKRSGQEISFTESHKDQSNEYETASTVETEKENIQPKIEFSNPLFTPTKPNSIEFPRTSDGHKSLQSSAKNISTISKHKPEERLHPLSYAKSL